MRNGADRPAISTGPALMIPAGYPRDLPSALLRAARDFSTAGVVEIGPDGRETRLDFPTLLELAARILAGLRANGVRAGDPAVVHCTEPVGFFAAFWACTLGGIRPLLMSPSPEGDTTEEGRERLRKVTDLLGWAVLIGRPSDLPNDLGLPVLDPDALAGHEPTSEFHRPAADDVAVLMMTSGSSTGTPKIIQLTHRGLVEFAAGTPAMLPVRPGQTTLNWLPLDHSGAFLLYHLLPVFTGCTNIHVATDWVLADPLRWLELMDQHRVNHSWSPNFGYRLAAAAIAGEPDRHWDLSALRSLVSGGEQITVPVVSEFLRLTNRFGVVPETFVAAWGMTETVTGITFARPGLTPNVHRVRISQAGAVEWVDQRTTTGKVAVARPGKGRTDAPGVLSLVSVGAPAPGATVRIVGPNGAVLPEGRIGQLQIASARVTPGYLGNPDADRAAFPAGNWPARKWLATGDQGFMSGGQVVITGRDSERIILNGQTYYAHEIEAVAATAPGSEAGLVAACGVADAALGTERLLIFYALSSESAEGADEAIRSMVRGRLGLDARVVGVPSRHFPTTPGGKILRPLLKQRWLDNTLETAPGPYATPPTASPYGDPIRVGSIPTARADFDEDTSEQTTELPVVRLAWRRTLQDSIPHPPSRPTLGANRLTTDPPPPPTAPTHADALSADTDDADALSRDSDAADALSADSDVLSTGTPDADAADALSTDSGTADALSTERPEASTAEPSEPAAEQLDDDSDAFFNSAAFSTRSATPTAPAAPEQPEPQPAEPTTEATTPAPADPTPDLNEETTQLPAIRPAADAEPASTHVQPAQAESAEAPATEPATDEATTAEPASADVQTAEPASTNVPPAEDGDPQLPSADEATTEQPEDTTAEAAPAEEEPAAEAPTPDAPSTDAPAIADSAATEPTPEEQATAATAVQVEADDAEPAPDEPAAEAPEATRPDDTTEQPTAEEPTAEAPTPDAPTTDAPATADPATTEPTPEEQAAAASAVQEQVDEAQPTVDEPVAEEAEVVGADDGVHDAPEETAALATEPAVDEPPADGTFRRHRGSSRAAHGGACRGRCRRERGVCGGVACARCVGCRRVGCRGAPSHRDDCYRRRRRQRGGGC